MQPLIKALKNNHTILECNIYNNYKSYLETCIYPSSPEEKEINIIIQRNKEQLQQTFQVIMEQGNELQILGHWKEAAERFEQIIQYSWAFKNTAAQAICDQAQTYKKMSLEFFAKKIEVTSDATTENNINENTTEANGSPTSQDNGVSISANNAPRFALGIFGCGENSSSGDNRNNTNISCYCHCVIQ